MQLFTLLRYNYTPIHTTQIQLSHIIYIQLLMFIADKAATPYPNITQQRTSQQLFCPAHLQNIFFKMLTALSTLCKRQLLHYLVTNARVTMLQSNEEAFKVEHRRYCHASSQKNLTNKCFKLKAFRPT